MNKIHFALIGSAALALAACGSQEDDALGENVTEELQANELNMLADNAAMEAEMEALGNQQEQLEETTTATNTASEPADDVTTEPSEVEDDVQGM